MAPSVGERVAAIIGTEHGTEMGGVSPDASCDALGEVASSLKLVVARTEKGLRTACKPA